MRLGLCVDGAQEGVESGAELGVATAGLVGPAIARIRWLIERAS
jgi:hypothetical protein